MPVVHTNDTDGIAIAANEAWTVPAGVIVSADGGSAFFSAFFSYYDNAVLVNHGSVLATGSGGVGVSLVAGADYGFVFNDFGGVISAANGVYMGGAGHVVRNKGSIIGVGAVGAGISYFGSGGGSQVYNDGYVFGRVTGINAAPFSGDGGKIANRGTIESDRRGITIAAPAGQTTEITNAGTIDGRDSSIAAFAGAFSLVNTGRLFGDIDAVAAGQKDTVVNRGQIAGSILLGSGNDRFDGRGGTSGTVFGEAGNDKLTGGNANDVLSGGAGKDALAGGAGRDRFVFDAALSAATNVDTVAGFAVNADRIVLDGEIFTAAGAPGTLAAAAFRVVPAAADASDRIIYSGNTGALFYDPDGNGARAPIRFATLSKNLDLDHRDFLII